MRIEPKQKPNRDQTQDTGPITGANYQDRVSAFLKLGATPFAIRALDGEKGAFRTREPATEPQWLAWRTYFISKGMMGTVRFIDAHGVGTVPSEYPELFDKDAPVSDPFARLPRKAPQEMEAMRVRLNRLFSGLTREVGAWPSEGRRKMPSRAEQALSAKDRLVELDAMKDEPLALSESAKRLAFSNDEVDF